MSSFSAFASVFLSGGSFAAFFKPRHERLAADTENAADPAQRSAFMVGCQYLCLEVLAVAALFRILATALLAGMAKVFLLAVWGFAVFSQMIAAAMTTENNFRNHSNSVQHTVYTRPLP